jgi:Cof subfamily protein (haloacid dehalogenase superfamily)
MSIVRAVVSDFDGTLAFHRHIPQAVSEAIQAFTRQGGIFSIATGRAFEGTIEQTCAELGLADLHIVRGGAEIYSRKNQGVVWGKYIDNAKAQEVLAYLYTVPELYIAAEHGALIYSVTGLPNEEFGDGAQFRKLAALPHSPIPKIIVPPFQQKELVMPVYEKLKKMFPDLHIIRTSSSRGLGIDINAGDAGKHAALAAYAKLMNIERTSILGVGDSYNDFPLLEMCGIKVAVGNAAPELKAVADYVVQSVDKNGMIEVLNLVHTLNNT